MYSFVFKRYELKYLLSPEQYTVFLAEILRHMKPDAYGETTIQSLYYDTPDFRLVRASIEKPIYKEKLRLRCYGLNDSDKNVFLEMKRKYDGVVYKRRIAMKEGDENAFLSGGVPGKDEGQIERELRYFISCYPGLEAKAMILYDRSAFFATDSELRVTFDRNIRFRTEDLDFRTSLEGERLVGEGQVLMEIKTGSAIPLWLCELLDKYGAQKSSFSKYGAAYARMMQKSGPSYTILNGGILLCSKQYLQTGS